MQTRDQSRGVRALVASAVLSGLAGWAAADTAVPAGAADAAAPYQRMAHLEEYLMSPADEVALARSAAPAAISGKATVLVLEPRGYETASTGTNGFTCVVERSWMAPFDSREFWNPKMRAPICYNAAAAKSSLAYIFRRTQLALAGRSRQEMLDEVRGAVARKEVPAPEPGAMSFMMSRDGYLGDDQGHWHSHLMFHLPKAGAASWGANVPGSPVILDERVVPEPQSIFLVPVAHWSDGTESPTS